MRRFWIVFLVLAVPVFTGCFGGEPTCEKVIDKAVGIYQTEGKAKAMEMIEALPAEARKEARENLEKTLTEIGTLKPAILKQCETHKAQIDLECLMKAEGLEEMTQCEGADLLDPEGAQREVDDRESGE